MTTLADDLRAYWEQAEGTTLLGLAAELLPFYRQRPHTDYLTERLTEAIEAVENGEDRRLIVEMPPGQGKSSMCSVALPLYALSRNPGWEVLLVSAEASLATKFSRDCRRHVTDGNVPNVHLSAESAAVTEWETSENGSVVARGVGGQITGRRARLLVIDDPLKNLTEAHSRFQRDLLWDTWQSVLKPRLRPGALVVLVQTRWHEDDLAGRLFDHDPDGWERIRLPALAEPDDLLGREIGEPLLTPQASETPAQALERWDQLRTEVGSYVWGALYQQRPSPTSGQVFNPDWWQRYETPPEGTTTITSWDLSFTDTGDYAVGQVWTLADGRFYLIDQVRGRWSFTQQVHQIRALADRYPHATAHIVEAAANGHAAVDELKREIPGIIGEPARGSKEIRAQAVAPLVEAKQVFIPERSPWLTDWLSEVTGFPSGAPHDDQVDAMSQALKRLRSPMTGTVSVNPASVGLPSQGSSSLSSFRRGR